MSRFVVNAIARGEHPAPRVVPQDRPRAAAEHRNPLCTRRALQDVTAANEAEADRQAWARACARHGIEDGTSWQRRVRGGEGL